MKNTAVNHGQTGSALLMAVLLLLVGGIVMGAMLTITISSAEQTNVSSGYEGAYQAADAGINRALFLIETKLSEAGGSGTATQRITEMVGEEISGDIGEGSYSVQVTDPVANDGMYDLVSEGSVSGSVSRTLGATVRVAGVKALDYSLFGNYIHFDNHNNVNFGIRMTTSVYSNSRVEIDPGIAIEGTVRAVQFIEPSPASGSLDATVLIPAGEQGDPDPTEIPSAPVKQVQPAPQVLPFPAFDFGEMETLATANRRLLSSGEFSALIQDALDYAISLGCGGSSKKKGKKTGGKQGCENEQNVLTPLPNSYYPSGLNYNQFPVSVIHHSWPNLADGRVVRIPTVVNPEQVIYLGSPNGVSYGPQDTYEIIIEGDPLPGNDTVTYVDGDFSLDLPSDVLLRVEGSLIVNGAASIGSAVELLAWENRTSPWFVPLGDRLYSFAASLDQVGENDGFYDVSKEPIDRSYVPTHDIKYSKFPAIAANGKLKISGSTGPAHIEGVVYTIAESHIHQSELQGSVYICGTEIADIIHNCEYISLQYEPEARETMGLGNRVTGRAVVEIVRYFAPSE